MSTNADKLKIAILPNRVVAEYLKSWLPGSPSLFAALSQLEIESGRSFAWLPEVADADAITSLDWGGVVGPQYSRQSRRAAENFVDRIAVANDALGLIAFDPVAPTGEGAAEQLKARPPHLESHGWMYFRSDPGNGPWDRPSDVLNDIGLGYPTLAVLCPQSLIQAIWDQTAAPSSLADQFVTQVRCLVLGAFDAETYAIWLPGHGQ
jgi:hypothetical protein